MSDLANTLRQLADDLEQRPDERCWQVFLFGEWSDRKPSECIVHAFYSNEENGGIERQLRRKPKTSRERFEEWAFCRNESHPDFAWETWVEAERQAREAGDE